MIYFYNMQLSDTFQTFLHSTLQEVLLQQKYNFQTHFNSDIGMLKKMAKVISEEDYYLENSYIIPNDIIENTSFDALVIADLTGYAYVRDGDDIYIGDREYFKRSIYGDLYVGFPINSRLDNKIIIPVSIPILNKDNKVVSILVGFYNIKKISNIIQSAFGGKSRTFIINKKGELFFSTINYPDNYFLEENYTIFLGLDSVEEFYEGNKADFFEDINLNKEGFLSFKVNNTIRYSHYSPIGLNDWYILVSVDDKDGFLYLKKIKNTTIMLLSVIYVIIISLFLYITIVLFKKNKELKDVQEKLTVSMAQLKKTNSLDCLTGVLNRKTGEKTICQIISRNLNSQSSESSVDMALFIIDLDYLKKINDNYGHQSGDQALIGVAKTLLDSFRREDIIFRLGGDEFMAFIPQCATSVLIENCSKRIINGMKEVAKKQNKTISVSIGVAMCNSEEKVDFTELYNRADKALYHRKHNGKNGYTIYSDKLV